MYLKKIAFISGMILTSCACVHSSDFLASLVPSSLSKGVGKIGIAVSPDFNLHSWTIQYGQVREENNKYPSILEKSLAFMLPKSSGDDQAQELYLTLKIDFEASMPESEYVKGQKLVTCPSVGNIFQHIKRQIATEKGWINKEVNELEADYKKSSNLIRKHENSKDQILTLDEKKEYLSLNKEFNDLSKKIEKQVYQYFLNDLNEYNVILFSPYVTSKIEEFNKPGKDNGVRCTKVSFTMKKQKTEIDYDNLLPESFDKFSATIGKIFGEELGAIPLVNKTKAPYGMYK